MTNRARSGEPELVALRKLAEELARGRKERPSTGHLLAAIAQRPSVATDLLQERMLDADVLLKAARVVLDDSADAIQRAVQRARDFAARSVSREPTSLHLLYALCQERTCAAHRAIEQCGIDVTKLRTAALQVASGIAAPRRIPRAVTAPRPPVFPAIHPSALPVGSAPPSAPALPKSSGLSGAPKMPAPPSAPALSSALPKGSGLSGAPKMPAPPVVPQTSASPVVPPSAPPVVPTSAPKVSGRPGTPPIARKKTHRQPAPQTPASAAEARFQLDPQAYPLLSQIGKNLTLAAARGELEPSTLREAEIERRWTSWRSGTRTARAWSGRPASERRA